MIEALVALFGTVVVASLIGGTMGVAAALLAEHMRWWK